jgi:hypothetical protein
MSERDEMPEAVSESVGHARQVLADWPEAALTNLSGNAIRWLADKCDRLQAALDKAERQRDHWEQLHEQHCERIGCFPERT